MDEGAIRAEAEKIVRRRDRKAPDNVLIGDVVDLCLRVREADAKLCDAVATQYSSGTFNDCSREVRAAEECAETIRALKVGE